MNLKAPTRRSKRWVAVAIPAFLVLTGVGAWFGWQITGAADKQVLQVVEPQAEAEEPATIHVPLPEEVRGIYWTSQTAGDNRADELVEYMLATGLNAVVIDLKTDGGALAFVPNNESLAPYVMADPMIADLDGLLARLKEKNIYRIARVAVMRDGAMAKANPALALRWPGGSLWQDNIGSLWVDPAAPEVADYALALAREAYARGFDEIQFDYVRFASDGKISGIVFPVYDGTKTKVEVMQTFFKNVGGALREEGIPVSFDLFGMNYWQTNDFGIGQRLPDAEPYADFLSPMVYPSHYPDGFKGLGNPALYPYEIVKWSLDEGAALMERESGLAPATFRPKSRPWLQDFDIGAVYTADLIEAQIKATRDAGGSGWMLWNARNVYEPADYLSTE